jgi:hypothetical protein
MRRIFESHASMSDRHRALLEPALLWLPVERGEVVVSARAFEAGGATQPPDGARNSIHAVRLDVQ